MDTPSGACHECWLRYAATGTPPDDDARAVGSTIIAPAAGRPPIAAAVAEAERGLEKLLGVRPERKDAARAALVVGDLDTVRAAGFEPDPALVAACGGDGYLIQRIRRDRRDHLLLCGPTDAGALHAVHRLLATLELEGRFPAELSDRPAIGLRMIDHWDNLDGVIERGYAGRSLFFRDGAVVKDLGRVRDYARLLGSIGINAVAVNNVNVHAAETRLVEPDFLPEAARLAEVFRAHGVRMFLSVSFASPVRIGGMASADPQDPEVRRWWRERAGLIYRTIPDFGGFVVKADSEGQPGPHTYGRTHAEGANMLAQALSEHGGTVLWRCFVYNHRQDWRDRTTDRARAAYDHFLPQDGSFADNVVLQIKNGPMDFQVREPVSPLFGGLARTRVALELQIAQEYTGQQRHLYCLLPQWKEYLDFKTYAPWMDREGKAQDGAPIRSILTQVRPQASLGRPQSTTGRPQATTGRGNAMVGVANTGDDPFWTGHPLAQVNLYGFGRLAWDPGLEPGIIVDEWIRRTLGRDESVRAAVSRMLAGSWRIYESYTAPLGVGWMVTPHTHDGPSPDGYEYSRWGTYHFADHDGIGVDRTVKTGTGYTAQYHQPNAGMYDDMGSCPDELLLFFHHVPYRHRLKSGKTVIQHIYDTHFRGVEDVRGLRDLWAGLEGKVDAEVWRVVRDRLEDQQTRAEEWRDVINTYFFRRSGIADELGRTIY